MWGEGTRRAGVKVHFTLPLRKLSFSLLHPGNSFQFILLHVLVMAWVFETLKYFIYTWNWIFFFLWNIAMETCSLCWKRNDWKCSSVTNLLQGVFVSACTQLYFWQQTNAMCWVGVRDSAEAGLRKKMVSGWLAVVLSEYCKGTYCTGLGWRNDLFLAGTLEKPWKLS